jgi:hypothetical protein
MHSYKLSIAPINDTEVTGALPRIETFSKTQRSRASVGALVGSMFENSRQVQDRVANLDLYVSLLSADDCCTFRAPTPPCFDPLTILQRTP